MKNKLRKMLSLVLSVVIAMSAISLNTFAATIMNIVNGSNQKLYVDWYDYSYNFNGRLNTSTYGQIIKLNVGSPTGQVAYCIQSSKDAWTSDYTAQKTYNLLSLTQQQNLKHALIYGYQGTTKYGYNADTERIATSIVTWNICDGWFNNSSESTAVGIFTEDMSSSMATNVKACYNKIKEQMLSHLTIPSYAVKPTVTNVPKQKMTTNSDGTFTITLTDSKNVSKYYDWQTAIKKYSYLSIITDTEGKLVIKSTKPIPSSSAITLTAERNSSKYQNNIVDVAPMYMISGSGSQSSATFVTDRDPSTAKIAIYSDSLGTAQIKKVWEHKHDSSSTQASNSDIYFTIKNSSGSAVKATGKAGSYTYSASGSVTKFKLNSSNTFLVKSLPAGTYTVYEFGNDGNGIPNYTRKNLSQTVTVTAGGTGTVTFKNTRNTGTGKVIKTWVDTNGNAIAASNNVERNKQIDKARSAIRAMEIQHGLENDTIRYGITLEGTDRDLQFFRFASNLDLEEITLSPDKKAALQVMENISKWEKDGLVQYNSDNTSISLTKLGQKKLYSDLADGVDLIDESVIAPKNLSSGSLSNAGAGSMATQATSQTAVQTTQVASATATQATTAGATQAATTAATTATTAASSAVPVAGAVVVTTKVVSDTAKKISDAIIRR